MPKELECGGIVLYRATAVDIESITNLQCAAYARNRPILGVEPLPLQADYANILGEMEVWVKRSDPGGPDIDAVLILDTERFDDLLIWSIATRPASQGAGLGHKMLACAEQRARQLARDKVRLYTGEPLTHLIDWYSRNGYAVERTEILSDRTLVHMLKTLASPILASATRASQSSVSINRLPEGNNKS